MIYSTLIGSKIQRELTILFDNPTIQPYTEITLGFIKIDRVNDEEIIGHDSQREYHLIRGTSMHIQKGETYSFVGTIMKSGRIKIKRIQHHPYRLYKYLISGSAILLVIYLIFRNIRIQKKGKYLTLT